MTARPLRRLENAYPAAEALLRKGTSPTVVAARFGVHPATARRAARRLGLPPHPRGPPPRKGSTESWALLYASGLSVARIARRYGTSPGVVYLRLRRRGVRLRTRTEATLLYFRSRKLARGARDRAYHRRLA